ENRGPPYAPDRLDELARLKGDDDFARLARDYAWEAGQVKRLGARVVDDLGNRLGKLGQDEALALAPRIVRYDPAPARANAPLRRQTTPRAVKKFRALRDAGTKQRAEGQSAASRRTLAQARKYAAEAKLDARAKAQVEALEKLVLAQDPRSSPHD